MSAGEQELADACERYLGIVHNPEPGLAMWSASLWNSIRELHALTSEAVKHSAHNPL